MRPDSKAKRHELLGKGVEMTNIVDHQWAKSIYFKDPNGLQLEYCCLVREFTDNDSKMQPRFEIPVGALGLTQRDPVVKTPPR